MLLFRHKTAKASFQGQFVVVLLIQAMAVVAVLVRAGDVVERGTPLLVLEAMKMEHTIVAPAPGTVVAVNYAAGERVREGADLVDIDGE